MNAWGSNENEAKGSAVSHSNVVSPPINVVRKRQVDSVAENYLVAVGSRTSRFRRKQQHKIIIAILIFLVILLLILLIILSIYYDREKKKMVCETEECIRSAANLIMSMDPTADPCKDFYQYACGRWALQHPKPDFMSAYDWFSEKRKSVDLEVRNILSSNKTKSDPIPLAQSKDMYKACTNTEKLDELGIKPIKNFLKSVKIPTLPNFLNLTVPSGRNFSWLESIILIKKRLSLDVLIGFDIFPAPKNVTLKRLVLGEPTATNPLPVYIENDKILKRVKEEELKQTKSQFLDDLKDEDDEEDKDSPYRKNVKILMTQAVRELYKSLNKSQVIEVTDKILEENVGKAVDEYVEFSKAIYELYEELENETLSNENYTSIEEEEHDIIDDLLDLTVDKIQEEVDLVLTMLNYSTVDVFKPYLLGIFNGSGVTLDFQKDIILTSKPDLKFLFAVMTMIQSTSPDIVELFVWCQAVENLIPHSTTTLRSLYDKCINSLTGAETSAPRSIKCSSSIGSIMGMAVGYAVVNPKFINTTLPKVEKMLENIRSGFEDLISSLTWMDLATKSVTIEKVRTMRSLIGFPKWLKNVTKLEEYYTGVVASPEKHLENLIGLVELSFSNRLKYFRKPYIFTWDTEPTEVNAYHTFQANAITVPMVMLQYPFYDLGLESLNYGAIGSILGHEITHGFDDKGRQYDKNGNFTQWWSNNTIDLYKDKTKCFVNQYSGYYVPEIDKHVDGNLTLGENIADNGGIRSALRGYWKENEKEISLPGLSHLNNNQLFFLSYANLWCGINTAKSLSYDIKDEHSPNHLRLRGALQNVPEFAEEFKCKKNTTMNPSNGRCIIF